MQIKCSSKASLRWVSVLTSYQNQHYNSSDRAGTLNINLYTYTHTHTHTHTHMFPIHIVKAMVFPVVMYRCDLDNKEG